MSLRSRLRSLLRPASTSRSTVVPSVAPPAGPASSPPPAMKASDAPRPSADPRKRPMLTHQGTPSRWGARATWTSDVVGDITPDSVATAIAQADNGDPRLQAQMLLQIQNRDAHLVSVLGTRYRAVANLPFEVKPASTSPRDVAIAAWVNRELKQIRGWRKMLLQLSAGILTGYAAVEIDWTIRPSTGEYIPAGFLYRPAEWFVPAPEDPLAWRILDASAPVEGVPLWPGHWIVHCPQAKTGWPVQAGLGRVVLWAYMFGRFGQGDWANYTEKFGAPFRVGSFPDDADDGDIADFKASLQELGIDGLAVVPQGWDVKFQADGGGKTGGASYQPFVEFFDRLKSKVVLGQTLTTEAGPNGTQALGTVQNDVRRDIRDADASELAEALTEQLVRQMVGHNFGWDVPVPRGEFEVSPPADREVEGRVQESRAKVFAAAVAAGVPVSLAQAQEELAIRPVVAGEPLLGVPMPGVAPAPASTPAVAVARDTLTLAELAWLAPSACPSCGGARLTASDSPGDAFEGLVSSASGPVAAAWRALIEQLGADLARVTPGEDLTAAVGAALRRLDTNAYVDALYEATVRAEVLGLLQARSGAVRPKLPSGAPDGWAGELGLPEAQWSRTLDVHMRRAEDNARAALLRVADRLLEAARAAQLGPAVEASLEDSRATSGLVSLSAGVAWGQGAAQQQERDRARKPYFRYHTMEDAAVRPPHAAMNNRIYAASHPIWQVWRPPNGWHCRCWLTAHSLEEIEKNGWTITEDWPSDTDGDGKGPAAGVKLSGKPVLPDKGFRQNFQLTAEEHDFSAFPAAWRLALGLPA